MGLNSVREYKPAFTLASRSGDITDIISNHLSSLTLRENTGSESDRLTLVLAPPDNFAVPGVGEILTLTLGIDLLFIPFGKFTVSNTSTTGGPRLISITADSTPFSNKKQAEAMQSYKTRQFKDTTLNDVLETIAGDNKLTLKISDKFKNIKINHLLQTRESDLNLCFRLGTKYGATFKIAYDLLLFLDEYAMKKDKDGKELQPIMITPEQVTSWSANFGTREKANKVVTKFYDVENGYTKEIVVGSGKPVLMLPFTYPNKEEATHAAQAEFNRKNTNKNTIEIKMPVTSKILPMFAGCTIQLIKFDPAVDAAWITTSLDFDLSSSGFSLRISAINRSLEP